MYFLFTTDFRFDRMIASLDKVEAETVRLNVAIEEECRRWRANLEKADAEVVGFASLGMVVVAGCKAD